MTAEEVIRKMIAEHRGTMLAVEYTYLNGLKAALAAVQLAAPEEAPLIEIGELVLIPDGLGTVFAQWNMERYNLPPGTKLYGRTPMNKQP